MGRFDRWDVLTVNHSHKHTNHLQEQVVNNETTTKNHAQFHTARLTDYEQATKNAFRSATLVCGFLTDFGSHSPETF